VRRGIGDNTNVYTVAAADAAADRVFSSERGQFITRNEARKHFAINQLQQHSTFVSFADLVDLEIHTSKMTQRRGAGQRQLTVRILLTADSDVCAKNSSCQFIY
jgi:hypothetical protein